MDLSTTYMGLQLRSPLVPSSSPLSRELDKLRAMEDAGAGAVVLWSLFEEQIRHDAAELDHYLHYGAERFAESLTYFPPQEEYRTGPDDYLEHIRRAKEAVDIPIIASLNGVSAGGWTAHARKVAEAGADAIELNVYLIPTNPQVDAATIEDVYVTILRTVAEGVDVPVAMKLSPYFSATANVLARLDAAGADGLVLFNRFYQPDLDVEKLEVRPAITLSSSADSRLPLRWIALTYGRVEASLAATTGVHTGEDAAKCILAGADVAMLCSALLQNGVEHLGTVREDLGRMGDAKGYGSVAEMRGVLSQQNCPEPAAFERANYMKALERYGHTRTLE